MITARFRVELFYAVRNESMRRRKPRLRIFGLKIRAYQEIPYGQSFRLMGRSGFSSMHL
jgi:hypothetical protein